MIEWQRDFEHTIFVRLPSSERFSVVGLRVRTAEVETNCGGIQWSVTAGLVRKDPSVQRQSLISVTIGWRIAGHASLSTAACQLQPERDEAQQVYSYQAHLGRVVELKLIFELTRDAGDRHKKRFYSRRTLQSDWLIGCLVTALPLP